MALAHLVQGNETYREWYQDRRGYGDFVILDNGVAEGSRVSDQTDLHRLAVVCDADELVVPDELGRADKTLKLAEDFGETIQGNSLGYMGVAQGDTIDEALYCARGLARHKYITSLGVPRYLNKSDKFGRYKFLERLQNERLASRFHRVHCLGAWSKFPQEVVILNTFPFVDSIDTSLPVVKGLAGHTLTSPLVRNRQKTFFYLDPRLESGTMKLCKENVAKYVSWAT